MARKKKTSDKSDFPNAYIEGAGQVVEQQITATLETNYMPYAMSVIVSRAFPEIDGFKPSHRKLLYTMYKMGLLNGAKTKSANVVGQTMKLNPHGDGAIYDTMVRLSRGNEALLHSYVDSKGNFGKHYSRDMQCAASRYTEVKLDSICVELFKDIDKNTVDFIPNYDNTMLEPTLLPASYPSILLNSNVGIGVSMASSICSFNLTELCETTIAYLRNPEHKLISTLKAPDFSGGAYLLYDENQLEQIYKTGRGSVKLRAKYNYDKASNCIEITEIPASTTIEAIIEKIVAIIKLGKVKEISYIRDETDKNGLKIAIDIKRGVDPDKLMAKLFKLTPLQDNFSCNFNILVNGYPKVMGVREILYEWTEFRKSCIKRQIEFDLNKKIEKLHLLKGLKKILLDIDKAIKVVRETADDSEVVPNLMIAFGIDEIQAEYVAEIKLRQLNRDYILKRTAEISSLEEDIQNMTEILASESKQKQIIIQDLKDVSKKYHMPRKTMLLYDVDDEIELEIEEVPDYPVKLFLTSSCYFKKITPQSLRMSGEHKFKDGDTMLMELDSTNLSELLFFTDKCEVYKAKVSFFDDTKASLLGDYVPAKLGFSEDENLVSMVVTTDYKGYIIFVYENGKVAKVPFNSYETKTNRKKLTKAFSDKSKLIDMFHIENDSDLMLRSSNGRMIIFNTALLLPKTSRDTIGVQALTLKSKNTLEKAFIVDSEQTSELNKYYTKSIPVAGSYAKDIEDPDQLQLI